MKTKQCAFLVTNTKATHVLGYMTYVMYTELLDRISEPGGRVILVKLIIKNFSI